MADPEVFVFFCEDVREETGNKHSYMGMLTGQVAFPPDTNRIKGIYACGIIRPHGAREIVARMVISVPGRDEPIEMPIEHIHPEGEERAAAIQVHAALNNMPLVNGFTLECVLTVNDATYTDRLTIVIHEQED